MPTFHRKRRSILSKVPVKRVPILNNVSSPLIGPEKPRHIRPNQKRPRPRSNPRLVMPFFTPVRRRAYYSPHSNLNRLRSVCFGGLVYSSWGVRSRHRIIRKYKRSHFAKNALRQQRRFFPRRVTAPAYCLLRRGIARDLLHRPVRSVLIKRWGLHPNHQPWSVPWARRARGRATILAEPTPEQLRLIERRRAAPPSRRKRRLRKQLGYFPLHRKRRVPYGRTLLYRAKRKTPLSWLQFRAVNVRFKRRQYRRRTTYTLAWVRLKAGPMRRHMLRGLRRGGQAFEKGVALKIQAWGVQYTRLTAQKKHTRSAKLLVRKRILRKKALVRRMRITKRVVKRVRAGLRKRFRRPSRATLRKLGKLSRSYTTLSSFRARQKKHQKGRKGGRSPHRKLRRRSRRKEHKRRKRLPNTQILKRELLSRRSRFILLRRAHRFCAFKKQWFIKQRSIARALHKRNIKLLRLSRHTTKALLLISRQGLVPSWPRLMKPRLRLRSLLTRKYRSILQQSTSLLPRPALSRRCQFLSRQFGQSVLRRKSQVGRVRRRTLFGLLRRTALRRASKQQVIARSPLLARAAVRYLRDNRLLKFVPQAQSQPEAIRRATYLAVPERCLQFSRYSRFLRFTPRRRYRARDGAKWWRIRRVMRKRMKHEHKARGDYRWEAELFKRRSHRDWFLRKPRKNFHFPPEQRKDLNKRRYREALRRSTAFWFLELQRKRGPQPKDEPVTDAKRSPKKKFAAVSARRYRFLFARYIAQRPMGWRFARVRLHSTRNFLEATAHPRHTVLWVRAFKCFQRNRFRLISRAKALTKATRRRQVRKTIAPTPNAHEMFRARLRALSLTQDTSASLLRLSLPVARQSTIAAASRKLLLSLDFNDKLPPLKRKKTPRVNMLAKGGAKNKKALHMSSKAMLLSRPGQKVTLRPLPLKSKVGAVNKAPLALTGVLTAALTHKSTPAGVLGRPKK